MTKKIKESILTAFFNDYSLRQDIMLKANSMPNRCRIRGFERKGNFVMEIEFPAEWVADFND